MSQDSPTVFTSDFLRSCSFCCESACLHCPYGHTVRTHGFEMEQVQAKEVEKAALIINPKKKNEIDISAMFLEQAYGKQEKEEINRGNYRQFSFLFLKGHLCGLIRLHGGKVRDLYLLESFSDQGIDKDLVQGYLT